MAPTQAKVKSKNSAALHDVPARDHHDRREHTNDRKRKKEEIHACLSATGTWVKSRATLSIADAHVQLFSNALLCRGKFDKGTSLRRRNAESLPKEETIFHGRIGEFIGRQQKKTASHAREQADSLVLYTSPFVSAVSSRAFSSSGRSRDRMNACISSRVIACPRVKALSCS